MWTICKLFPSWPKPYTQKLIDGIKARFNYFYFQVNIIQDIAAITVLTVFHLLDTAGAGAGTGAGAEPPLEPEPAVPHMTGQVADAVTQVCGQPYPAGRVNDQPKM